MNLIRFIEIPVTWADEDFSLKLREGVPVELSFRRGAPFSSQSRFWSQELMNSLVGKSEYFPIAGSEFQQKVWREIAQIPWGELRTYTDIALAIGRPQSVRAVASACGKNPLPLFIPCHRVIGKNDWGGFSGGIVLKKKLLKMEGHLL